MANTLSLRGVLTVAIATSAALTHLNIAENGTYTPPEGYDGFDEVVANVQQQQPVIESKNITANGTYTAPSGVDGFSPVVVNVPQQQPVIESKNITANGTYTAPSGVDGFSPVVVNVPAGVTINKIADNLNIGDTSTYITAYFDQNITLNKWYLISVKDNNTINNAVFYLSSYGESIYVPLYNEPNARAYVYADSINLYSYSGDYRNIYCRICEIPTEMEVPIT